MIRLVPALFALVACGGAEPTAPAPAPAPAPAAAPAPAPAAAPAKDPITDDTPGNAEAGAKVYETYCKACHQADGTGMNSMLAANFKEPGRLDKTDIELLTSIRDGFTGKVGTMPPWGATLDDQEMRDALAYVRATFTPE